MRKLPYAVLVMALLSAAPARAEDASRNPTSKAEKSQLEDAVADFDRAAKRLARSLTEAAEKGTGNVSEGVTHTVRKVVTEVTHAINTTASSLESHIKEEKKPSSKK